MDKLNKRRKEAIARALELASIEAALKQPEDFEKVLKLQGYQIVRTEVINNLSRQYFVSLKR